MTKCAYGESARMTSPKAIRIEGNGQYASVSFRTPGATIVLCGSYAEAKALKRQIDDTGCGGQCTGKHAIFEAGLPRVTFVRDYITADLPRRADGRIGPYCLASALDGDAIKGLHQGGPLPGWSIDRRRRSCTQLSDSRRQWLGGADEPVCLCRTRNITEDGTPMTMTTWQRGRRDHPPRWDWLGRTSLHPIRDGI
jgi:hypothetical protein